MKKERAPRGLVPLQAAAGAQLPAQITADTLIEAFYRGKDPETVRSYQQRLGNFAEFLGVTTGNEAAKIFLGQGQGKANLLALSFQDHLLKTKGFSPHYVIGHLTALNSMVKLGRMLGLVTWTLEISRVKAENYKDTRGPGTEAVAQALDKLEKLDDPISVRDRTIVTLLYECCLRRGDLISLDLEHVDWKNRRIWPKRKKRAERTEVELHENGEKVLREWVKVRGEAPGPLFTNFDPSKKGDGRLSGMSIVRICHRYGLGRPHGLRHTGTTDALEVTGGNIPEVMRRTGHKDPKTLMIYDDNRKKTAAATSEKISALRKGKIRPE